MVRVARGVRLHYLDFGGTGPALVLLAGLGNTAHAFDDFAPRLTDRYHVIAITRRGFGESDHPKSGYEIKRLVEDIRVALDSLRLGRVTLVGHSIAGEELTRFAVTYPQRVDRLLYLDAAYDRPALDSALDSLHLRRVTFIGHSIAGEEMTRFAAAYPGRVDKLVYLDAAYDRVAAESMLAAAIPGTPDVPVPPVPSARDTATAAAYVAFVHRTRGVNIPESDIRARYRYDGWNEEITPAYLAIAPEHPDYRAVRAPALAIYAVIDSVSQTEPWQRADTARAASLQAVLHATEPVMRALRQQFAREVAHGQVIEIHGAHHWIFVSHRDQVLAAVRHFLDAR